MKKIELKSRKLLRFLFGCFSFTAIAFIFQACYGPAPAMSYNIKLSGKVTSKSTNEPIQGIKVQVFSDYTYGITDKNGNFNFYASIPECCGGYYYKDSTMSEKIEIGTALIYFFDIDSTENGHFADTSIFVKPARKDELIINMELIEKQ